MVSSATRFISASSRMSGRRFVTDCTLASPVSLEPRPSAPPVVKPDLSLARFLRAMPLTVPERIYPNLSHVRVGAHGDALCHDLDFVASNLNVMTTLPDDFDKRFPSYSRGEYLADLAAHVFGLALGL